MSVCYRCGREALLPDGMGMCRKCHAEVEEAAAAVPTQLSCRVCAHVFYNDWERIQHEARGRHNYRAWTADQGRVEVEKMHNRKPAA